MRILLIEPLNSVAGKLQRELRQDGHYVVRTPCGKKGSEIWLGQDFDLLVMDWEPEEFTASEVLANLLGSDRLPARAIFYSLAFGPNSDSMEDRVREITRLMPLERVVFLWKLHASFVHSVCGVVGKISLNLCKEEV